MFGAILLALWEVAVVAAEVWQAALVERASMPEAERWSIAAAQVCARVELVMLDIARQPISRAIGPGKRDGVTRFSLLAANRRAK